MGTENENTCSICLDTENKNPFKTLKCGHKFHYECIEKWFLNSCNILCPYCREKIDETYIYNYDITNDRKLYRKITNNIIDKKINNILLKNVNDKLYNNNSTPESWINLFQNNKEYLLPIYKLKLNDKNIKISLFLRLYILYSNKIDIKGNKMESFNYHTYYDIDENINNISKKEIIKLFDLTYDIMTQLKKEFYINYLSIYNTIIMDIFMITIKELNINTSELYNSVLIISIYTILSYLKILVGKTITLNYFNYFNNNINELQSIITYQKEYLKHNYIIYYN